MKKEIEEFVQKNTGSGTRLSSVRKMINTISNLSSWSSDSSNRNEYIKISDDKLYNIINFYKNNQERFELNKKKVTSILQDDTDYKFFKSLI